MRLTISIALAAATLTATPTCAFGQSASNQATAEALFKQARDLMAAGKYSDACPKLAESQRLDPGTGTLLNLATCYEKNGQIASAWITYKGAVTAAQSANENDRAKLARTRAAALEPTLPTLTIVVLPAADRPDLQVTRDGESVGRVAWGTAIPVDPGAHTVQASAPGQKAWQGQAQVAGPGAKVSIEVPALEAEPQAPPAAPTPPAALVAEPPAPPTPGSTQRVIGLVVAGVGVLGLGAGGVFGVVAKSKNDSVPSQCNGSVCTATGISSLDDAKTAATVSTVAFVAGGVAVAAGVVVYIIAPRASSSTGLTVAPGSDGSVAGLTLRGVWR